MSQNSLFIDTWGWLVIGHRKETRHQEVKLYYQNIRKDDTAIYTSDYVIDELITILFRREIYSEAVKFLEAIFTAINLNQISLINATKDVLEEAWELRKRYQDKPDISFTDFTSMVIMKKNDIIDIVTDDNHFLHVGMGFTKAL